MGFQDFQLDDDGDLNIQNGDFVTAPSDVQHVEDIINSFIGEWKQYPILGVGLLQFLNSENPQQASTNIKQQLQSDGYSLQSVVTNIDGQGNLRVSFPNGIQRNNGSSGI